VLRSQGTITMSTLYHRTVLLTLGVVLAGCQAMIYGTAADLNALSIGMSKAEVVAIMGSPVSVSADVAEEHFIYKRMKHVISEWPRTYVVTFKDGKVVKYGEQYDERNVNLY
jgi:outer membrane protein assembly factor BamE (lipoprotein component of BamABCDE complex)